MKGIHQTLADLARLRARFGEHGLSDGTRPTRATSLKQISGFGSNPGNLRMLIHAGRELQSAAPLVIALHGCTQSASEYDYGSGWSELADALGFAVVFPEQQRVNNPNKCFNWFRPEDTRRGSGEALSIAEMIGHMTTHHAVDPQRVFIVGLSAGGAMAASMLAAYPDLIAGGAVIAGLPHGAADTVQEALQTMSRAATRSPIEWGDLVRAASPHSGRRPKLSFWHGSKDAIVAPQNLEESIKQWVNVHKIDQLPIEKHANGYSRRIWSNDAGEEVIEAITVSGMDHGVAIGTDDPDRVGNAGPFHFEVGISSSRHIAQFWGIGERQRPFSERSATVSQRSSTASSNPTQLIAGRSDTRDRQPPLSDGRKGSVNPAAFDPRSVIEKALRSAGLLGKRP